MRTGASTADGADGFWVAMGWFLATVFGAVALASASLPMVPESQAAPYQFGQLVHFEWLVVATITAFGIYRCAAQRVGMGIAAWVLTSAESFNAVFTAMDRMHHFHVAVAGVGWWYVLPILQTCLGLGYCIAGARVRLFEWRWQRLVTRLSLLDSRARHGWPTRHIPGF